MLPNSNRFDDTVAVAVLWRLASYGLAVGLLAACSGPGPTPGRSAAGCQLKTPIGTVSHVIYLQFDNVHFTRDDPNVPSDLEQMPHLLEFFKANGVLLSNTHTPLIAHTSTDILTTLTGLYPSSHGVPVGNSYRYYAPDGSIASAPTFAYWTDNLAAIGSKPGNKSYNLVTPGGKNTPAPWVAFTKAGCSVGAAGAANIVLENVGGDISTAFGAGSPQEAEVKADKDQAQADYVGVAIHCAKGAELCAERNGGRPDILPDEPGGYAGFMSLFGHKLVGPRISPSGPLADLAGKPIADDKGRAGFPGFDGMPPAVSLAYVAAMQEHGVPITYAYISDAHDDHETGRAFGPGEQGYVAQLKAYDDAFGAFFERLKKAGINAENTLFVAAADEGDHFVGSKPAPAGCDGVRTACTYPKIGQLVVDLPGLLAREAKITSPLTIKADNSASLWLAGNPAPEASTTRALERALFGVEIDNPLSGVRERLVNFAADRVAMGGLHMLSADATRNPTVAVFPKADYLLTSTPSGCQASCVSQDPKAAWSHGGVDPAINVTWAAFGGPGVKRLGTSDVWADESDVRPTMMALLGLRDSYLHDGRALLEIVDERLLPKTAADRRQDLLELGKLYTQLNAPLGEVGMKTLRSAAAALASEELNDAGYDRYRQALPQATAQRDQLAASMAGLLEQVVFEGKSPDGQRLADLSSAAQQLIAAFGS